MHDIGRTALLLAGGLAVAHDLRQSNTAASIRRGGAVPLLAVWSLLNVAVVLALFVDHVSFPLNLELMEGEVVNHVLRLLEGKPLYPRPGSDFVALAYNPLYYVISAPAAWIFGADRTTLRWVAILAATACGALIYLLVRQRTGKAWWGLIATGLFAASYRATDSYLDTAHADSCLLLSILLGTLLLERAESRPRRILGLLLLVAGFWLKQHGAWFVIGAIGFLGLRVGWRQIVPEIILVLIAGPGLYLLAGPRLFGPAFHYFTWSVPAGWSEFHLSTFARPAVYLIRHFLLLAIVATWTCIRTVRPRGRPDVFGIQLIMAAVSALMGSMDPGSNNNVYIPIATWLIIVSSVGIHVWLDRDGVPVERAAAHLGLILSFVLLIFDPTRLLTSPRADTSYHDLMTTLRAVPGVVYAPAIGPDGGYQPHPPITWVPLDDVSRGPRRTPADLAIVDDVLSPLTHPAGAAFVLTAQPLERTRAHGSLLASYRLVADFGDRFAPLSLLPRRWGTAFPRFLYGHATTSAGALDTSG